MLSSREIAIVIWLFLFFGYFTVKSKKIRMSFLDIIKTLFSQIKLIIFFVTMIIYVLVIVILLYLFGFWEMFLLKDTIIWFLFTGAVINIKYITSNSDKVNIKNIVTDNIRIIILLEYIANTYTFPLLIELILIPFLSLLIFTEIIAKQYGENEDIAALITNIQAICGWAIIIYVAINFIHGYKQLINIYYLKEIILPPMLTFLFIPFIYFWTSYSQYETKYNKGTMKTFLRDKIMRRTLMKIGVKIQKKLIYEINEDLVFNYLIINYRDTIGRTDITRLEYNILVKEQVTVNELKETAKQITNKVMKKTEFNALILGFYDYKEFIGGLSYTLGRSIFTKDGNVAEAININKGDYENMQFCFDFKKKNWNKQPTSQHVEIWKEWDELYSKIEDALYKGEEVPEHLFEENKFGKLPNEKNIDKQIAKRFDISIQKLDKILNKIMLWSMMDISN